MKYVKMLGLAAVAAAALMAFVGAGTASASVVCSTTVSPCPAGRAWATGTTVDFSSKSAVLADTFEVVKNTCEGTVSGTLTNGSSTATAKLTVGAAGLTWSKCTRTADTIKGGTLEIHNVAGTSNGTITASGFEVTSKIPSIVGEISCVFETGTGLDIGTLTEGNPAVADINAVVRPIPGSNANCPSTANWTATYTVTSPSTTGSLSTS